MAPIVKQSLHLEDTLEENPQTKAMLELFEDDTANFKKFSKAFLSTCQKISNAQVMMISASQELSYYLRLYGEQKSPLNAADLTERTESSASSTEQTEISSTLNEFATYIDEVSSCFQVLATQLNDTMIYPLNKIIENEFEEINTMSTLYKDRGEDQQQTIQKYLRLPNKKEYDQQRLQVNQEVFQSKQKFHETSMNYFTSLNMLQYKKEYMFIEPMISFVHGLKLFFKMGTETVNGTEGHKLDEFLEKSSNQICKVKTEMSEEINKNNQLIELLQQDESIYQAEQQDYDKENPMRNELVQKCGFLNLRSKFPLLFKWDRIYYFIQNGCLMHQQKNEVAGSVFLELKSDLTISLCEIDELKFTFQLNSQFPKKTYYFQANNERDRNEWIATLENAIKDDNKSKIQNYMNSNSQAAAIPRIVTKFEPKFELSSTFLNLKNNKMSKPQQGDSFKVRFLGFMNVRANKGNEYIHETIRQVMASRAKHNIFKMNEYNLIINIESLSLFSIPEEESEVKSDQSKNFLKARFDLNDLAFWSTHTENKRLFGFIIKEKNAANLKFVCLVFESDVDSMQICDAITNSARLAYQILVDEQKSEHFKKMKQTEKEILLQNINGLPDKQNSQEEDDDHHLLSVAENSPNPNFIVLDKEMLEYTVDFNSSEVQEASASAEAIKESSPGKVSTESDA